jgi:hypothetical protein
VNSRDGLDKVEKREFLTLPGYEVQPSVAQPVVSRYTDYTIPAPKVMGSFSYCDVCSCYGYYERGNNASVSNYGPI